MTQKTGNKWMTKKCGRCGESHFGYSGNLDFKGVEYVVCGVTHKRMNVSIECFTARDIAFGTVWELIKMPIGATITIDAPGSIANSPADVIEKALRDAGCTVTVTNEHPDAEGTKKATSLESWHVNLVVKHQPWGG